MTVVCLERFPNTKPYAGCTTTTTAARPRRQNCRTTGRGSFLEPCEVHMSNQVHHRPVWVTTVFMRLYQPRHHHRDATLGQHISNSITRNFKLLRQGFRAWVQNMSLRNRGSSSDKSERLPTHRAPVTHTGQRGQGRRTKVLPRVKVLELPLERALALHLPSRHRAVGHKFEEGLGLSSFRGSL